MEEIRRPMKVTTDTGVSLGHLVLNGPDRICDACSARVNSYADVREEGAPWDFTVCLPDFFGNADNSGDKIEIS